MQYTYREKTEKSRSTCITMKQTKKSNTNFFKKEKNPGELLSLPSKDFDKMNKILRIFIF